MKARLEGWLQKLGPAGVLALGLACFDAAFLFSTVLPLHTRALRAEASLDRAERRHATLNTSEATARDPLERLLSVFPASDGLPREVGQLFRLASEQKLQLAQGDYRLEQQGEFLQVYRISLPVKGSYPQVRAFVASALNAMPYLSLDSIRFERQHVGDAGVETQVRFSLFINKPAAKGSASEPSER